MKKDLKKQLFYDVIRTFILALFIFGPIAGIILKGYDFEFHPQKVVLLAALAVLLQVFFTVKTHFKKAPKQSKKITLVKQLNSSTKVFLGSTLALMLFVLPFISSKYWLTVFILALIYVLLGLGLNIVVGLAGLLDLGFVGFYAVGAYCFALGSQYLEIGFWLALPMSAMLAALFGMVLGFPVLRMHGDYLAIVTLGFGEIIRLVLNNWIELTGGPNGVRVGVPSFFNLEFTRRAKYGGTPFHEWLGIEYDRGVKYIFIYLVLLITVLLIIMLVNRLKTAPTGRAWEALREDEIACRSLGLNHVVIKLSAFSLGAAIAGVAGVFFAAYQGFVNPSSFTFFESALILAVVVLGGLGSTVGVVISATVLTILPELLRDFSEYRILVFGTVMVLMMIWKPRGLIKATRPIFNRETDI